MFNLVRKDIVMQKNLLALLMLMLCGYSALGVSSIIYPGLIFCLSIFMSAISLDEKSNIHMFLNSLPYTRKQIVGSKYVVFVLFTCMVALALLVGKLVFHGEFNLWKDYLLMFTIVLTTASFLLPFSYQFKTQYLYVGFIGLVGLYLLTISFLIPNLHDRIRQVVHLILTTSSPSLFIGIGIYVVVLYGFSCLLSIRIYQRKVF